MRDLNNSKRGASAQSYGLVIGLISVVALAAVTSSGGAVNSLFVDVGGTMGDVVSGADLSLPAPSPSASASASASSSPSPASWPITGSGTSSDPYKWDDGAMAASCYDYMNNPPASHDAASGNGVYELSVTGNPTVLCDMTTDGGGWTLVGKGREGWTWSDSGQGSISDLADNPTSNTVAALTSAQVQAILGVNWNSSVDGMRLERFSNINDTHRITPAYVTPFNWSEFLDCRHTGACSASNTQDANFVRNGGAAYTADLADSYYNTSYNDCRRVFTATWSSLNNINGFSAGSTCPSHSTCWQYGSENHCIPQSQVWVRQ